MAWYGWVNSNNGKNFGFISPWIKHAENASCVHFDKSSLEDESINFKDIKVGTCVTFNVISNGNPHVHATDVEVITSFVIPSTKIGKICQHFFRNSLLANGPLTVEELIKKTQNYERCPGVIKNVPVRSVKAFLMDCNIFRIVDDQVILPDVNDEISGLLHANNPSHSLLMINGLFSNNHVLRKYLYGNGGWCNGVKNFVSMNCDWFHFWNHCIFNKSAFNGIDPSTLNAIVNDMTAVFYFAKFIIHKGPLKISSLKGHFAQGVDIPNHVCVNFGEFLNRNCYFFKASSSCACKNNYHSEFDDENYVVDVHLNRLRSAFSFFPFALGPNNHLRDELAQYYYNLLEEDDNQEVQWLTGYYSQESKPPRKFLSNGRVDTLIGFLNTYPLMFNVKHVDPVKVSIIKPEIDGFDQSYYGEMAPLVRLMFVKVSYSMNEISAISSFNFGTQQKDKSSSATRNQLRKKKESSDNLQKLVAVESEPLNETSSTNVARNQQEKQESTRRRRNRKKKDPNSNTQKAVVLEENENKSNDGKAFIQQHQITWKSKVETVPDKFPMQCSDSIVESMQEISLQDVPVPNPDAAAISTAAAIIHDIPSNSIFVANEGQILRSLFGQQICRSINNISSSLNINLDNLICLRMNIGRKPSLKFFRDLSETSMVILDDCDIIKRSDLDDILSKNALSRINSGLYGVKGSLHQIRSIGRSDQVNSVSLFFESDKLSLEGNLHIMKRRRLTAVFTDDEKLPAKFSRTYIRNFCKELAEKLNDVVVIDFNKKLSGCEATPHESLGHVSVVPYFNDAELKSLVVDAIENMHDYIVITSIDTKIALESIEIACKKGKRVIAEIAMEMKEMVLSLFPE